MDYINSYNTNINQVLSPLDAPAAAGFLKMVLVLYGALAAPHLPKQVLKWFDFVPFKIFVLFLIVWTGNHDPALSILIATAFFVSMNVLAGKKAFESFRDGQYYDQEG